MNTNRLSILDDSTLRRELSRTIADERTATASALAYIAEFDARRLYLADACSSMHDYCVQVLHLSEGAAYKRIRAARAARRHPRLFADVAAGRLHLSAVCLLAPHLTDESVESLVAGATHRSKAEIERWLATRIAPATGEGSDAGADVPRARVIALRSVATRRSPAQLSPGTVDSLFCPVEVSQGTVSFPVPEAVQTPGTRRISATHVVQIPIDEETHALLREVQGLLGHTVRPGDLGAVFQRALVGLRTELLKR